jgi:uncharacterized membrane protein HdeD (DUF308 family)
MKKTKKRTTIKVLESLFNKYLLANILLSLVMIVLGIILYAYPEIAIKTVSWLIGIIFLVVGALSIYSYVKKDRITLFVFNLIYGISSIVIGLFVIINPFAIANILTVSLGIWLLVSGALKINYALRLKSINELSWALTLSVGIITILFALMVIFNPFTKLIIVEVIGLFLIVYGAVDLTDILLIKKRSKSFIKSFK